jgi:hypothetical protein
MGWGWIEHSPNQSPVAGRRCGTAVDASVVLGALALFLAIAHRVTQRGDEQHPLKRASARLAMPVAVLLAVPVVEHLTLIQLVLSESVVSGV